MTSEPQQPFGDPELAFSPEVENTIAGDETLTAIRNLLQVGIRMLPETDKKLAALSEAQKRLDEAMKRLRNCGSGQPS